MCAQDFAFHKGPFTRGNLQFFLTVALAGRCSADMSDTQVQGELELISAMYTSDELSIVQSAEGTLVSVKLRPHSGGADLQRFAECVMEIQLSPGYPEAAAQVRVHGTRGLVEEEEVRLLREVRACVLDNVGEPCLFAALEAGVALLTEMNVGGTCSICRDELFEPSEDEPDSGPRQVYLAPNCFHSFHVGCLSNWRFAYTPPASKGEAAEGAPSRASAARASARAADASLADLQAKALACNSSVEALTERLLVLRSVDPPAPAVALRKLEEEIAGSSAECARLESRATKAKERCAELAAVAETAAADEQLALQQARDEEPLPCPVCRTLIPAQSLTAGGISRIEPKCELPRRPDQPSKRTDHALGALASSTPTSAPPTSQPALQRTPQPLPPPPPPPETRKALDGQSYTKAEFYTYFGGYAEWDAAAVASAVRDTLPVPPSPSWAGERASKDRDDKERAPNGQAQHGRGHRRGRS